MKVLVTSVIIALILAGFQGFAQDGEIEDQQIIIEKDKPLTLPKASRLYKRTDIKPVTTDGEPVDYQITQPSYEFQPYFAEFSFRNYEKGNEKTDQDFQNYVKAGYGNYLSPLLQGYFGVSNETSRAGLWLNHESFGKGPVRGKESAYGVTELLLSGAHTTDLFFAKPEITFQREGYYPYGYTVPDAADFDYADRKIGAGTFGVGGDFGFTPKESLQILLSPDFKTTRMKFRDQDPFNRENQLQLDAGLVYDINDEFSAGLSTGFTYLDYVGGLEQNRSVFDINPYVDFQNNNLTLHGGFRFAALSTAPDTDESAAFFYPDLKAKFQLNSRIALFASLAGGLEPVTLANLRLQNRYLDDSLALLNESTGLDFEGGVESSIGERLRIKGFVGFEQTKNKAVFSPSVSDTSRFTVQYDSGSFKTFTIGGELLYIIHPTTNITLDTRINGYTPQSLDEPWYLPAVIVDLMASQTIARVLRLQVGLKVLGGIKGQTPVTYVAENLDPIVDLRFGAQYDVRDQISIFMDFDNLLSRDYERYINYPARGFMVKGGFIYRF